MFTHLVWDYEQLPYLVPESHKSLQAVAGTSVDTHRIANFYIMREERLGILELGTELRSPQCLGLTVWVAASYCGNTFVWQRTRSWLVDGWRYMQDNPENKPVRGFKVLQIKVKVQ